MSEPWTVLLIGGSSGTGKSALARALARRRGAEVASADDFRAVLWHVVPPERDPALHRFRGDPRIASYPPEAHAERWMGIARSVSAALVPVVGQRLATGEPLVVEGDAVDPALIARAEYAGRAAPEAPDRQDQADRVPAPGELERPAVPVMHPVAGGAAGRTPDVVGP